MASSQEKAVALKDAYVQGIMDGEIASETANAFSAMPEQDMGETASIVIRPGHHDFHDDGDPGIYMSPYSAGPIGMKQVGRLQNAANPGFRGENLTPEQAGAVLLEGKRNSYGGYSKDRSPRGMMKKQNAFDSVFRDFDRSVY